MTNGHQEPDNLTELLKQIRLGDTAARERFANLVYETLKKIARGKMRRERHGHTAQPTVLVHEAYLRIFGNSPIEFEDRGHFYRIAALQMRRYLQDYARARNGPARRRDLAVWMPEELLASPDNA